MPIERFTGVRTNRNRSDLHDMVRFCETNQEICNAIDPTYVQPIEHPLPSHWFVSIESNLELEPGAISLTVEIDRHTPSKTKSLLFSPTKNSFTSLPDRDWLSTSLLSSYV